MDSVDIHNYQKIIIKINDKIYNPSLVENNRRWIKIIDKSIKVEISRIRKHTLTGKEIDMDDIMFAVQCLCQIDTRDFIIIKNIIPDILILEPTYSQPIVKSGTK